ncbi:hypothetical protein SDC9_193519 [bioreactor metagenome]|uniref:Uncharacterized protein n=1 Tax=bioreactor metagenome TaxID=1076179 RepID=A0A645I4A1_9ZZZZ
MQFRIQNFDIGIMNDVACGNFLRATSFDSNYCRFIAVHFQAKRFYIENNIRNIFPYARNCREFMQYAVNLDGSNCCSRQRREKYATQTIP